MRRLLLAGLILSGWLTGAAGQASAQFQYFQPQTSPFYQPPVSPYLNLFRGGNPGINYYGLVRPQVQAQQNLQQLQLQQQLQAQQQAQQMQSQQAILLSPATQMSPLPTTGHPAYFNAAGLFFGSIPGRTGGTPTITGGTFGRR
jgi:hypothetical protein